MLTSMQPRRAPAHPTRRARRGLTLIELMMVLVILGLIGTAMTKLLVQQGRTFSLQQAQRESRIVSRNALGILLSELRMAQDSAAIDSVGTNGAAIRIELPYSFGISCGNSAGSTIVRLAPVDSLVQATAVAAGYRWRDATTGRWKTTAGTFTMATADAGQLAVCTAASIGADTIQGRAGRTVAIQPAAMNGATAIAAGTPIFVYQKVVYKFAASTAYPQGNGLYRKPQGGTQEELLGPFDASSRFRYFVTTSDNATSTTPTNLDLIRGLELVLNGESTRNAPSASTGKVEPAVSRVTTAVFFKNTRSF
jgi:prepilin-type N-terminal cleavage/methylation domain-containing protein